MCKRAVRTIEECPVCGRKVKEWLDPYPTGEDSSRSLKSRDIQEFRRTCPYCFSKLRLQFPRHLLTTITVWVLAIAAALSFLLNQIVFNIANSLAADNGEGAILLSIAFWPLTGMMIFAVGIAICSRVYLQWQLATPARRCTHCNSPITVNDAKFCPHCGTDQATGVEGSDHSEMKIRGWELPNRCIVCKMAIDPDDEVTWCPQCGGVAHRGEFLEWLHVKDKCPSCGKHVDEGEVLLGIRQNIERLGDRGEGGPVSTGKANRNTQ
jgi:predicted RNA-binding Zn-ribbon protein involved in translation (DUF1610 family)